MRQFFLNFRNWVILGLLCLTFTWSLPALADVKISKRLEEQVLQILRNHPEAIIESVEAYKQQEQQKIQQTRQAFLQQLATNSLAVIGDSPVTGATGLKTVLIEFSDFQCPYCSEAHKTLKELLAKYPEKLTLVYKHFPLIQIHDQAVPSAQAAWAAYQQGKFWEYHDALFTNQQQLGENLYLDIAKNLNLDLDKFNSDRNLATPAIQRDLELAYQLRLAGTPSLIIHSPNYTGVVQLADIERILTSEPS
ncbi:MAG TPA: DsbA family protein [Nostocaceae cyanobacterium]|nr:DsbA family protein [Nostocaceae cyanobacterium]